MEKQELSKEDKLARRRAIQNKYVKLFNNFAQRGLYIKLFYDDKVFDAAKAKASQNYQDLHQEIVLNKDNYQKVSKIYRFFKVIFSLSLLLFLLGLFISIYIWSQPWFRIGAKISKEHLGFYVAVLILWFLAAVMPFLSFSLIYYPCALATYHEAYLALKDGLSFKTLDFDFENGCLNNINLTRKAKVTKFFKNAKFINFESLNFNFLNSKLYLLLYQKAIIFKFFSFALFIILMTAAFITTLIPILQ